MSTQNLWLALAMAAMTMTACGGEPVDENDEQGAVDQNGKADSTKRPKVCGGIANLKCAKGYTCEITSKDPDATGKCIPSPAQTCDDLTCAAGTHCEMKGINGASIPVCLADPAQTCDDLTCAAGTHCEMKGINGASIPVCLND